MLGQVVLITVILTMVVCILIGIGRFLKIMILLRKMEADEEAYKNSKAYRLATFPRKEKE